MKNNKILSKIALFAVTLILTSCQSNFKNEVIADSYVGCILKNYILSPYFNLSNPYVFSIKMEFDKLQEEKLSKADIELWYVCNEKYELEFNIISGGENFPSIVMTDDEIKENNKEMNKLLTNSAKLARNIHFYEKKERMKLKKINELIKQRIVRMEYYGYGSEKEVLTHFEVKIVKNDEKKVVLELFPLF